MIAKIRTEDAFYDTMVFAIFNDGWNSEIIGFDEIFQNLIFIRFWAKKGLSLAGNRNIFIYDTNTIDETWERLEKTSGFSWLISNEEQVKCIRAGIEIDDKILDKCLSLQSLIKTQDYYDICNEQDIKNLMTVAMGFHDSYVEAIHTHQDETIILMNTTWGCKIEFTLRSVLHNDLEVGYGKSGEIFDASVFIENGVIFWVDEDSINSYSEIANNNKYFSAKEVRWKLFIT